MSCFSGTDRVGALPDGGPRHPRAHRRRVAVDRPAPARASARKLSQELNRAVLTSLSAQIAILDRDGTIIRVNEAWRDGARFGEVETHGDAFVGWNYLEECRRAEARGSEEAGKVRRGVEAVLERREWPFRHEYRWSAPDEHAYEIFVDRLQVSEGGAIVTHLDITDRRVAERRAEETRRQVAHMGRWRSSASSRRRCHTSFVSRSPPFEQTPRRGLVSSRSARRI